MEAGRLPVLSGFRLYLLLWELDKEEFQVFKAMLGERYQELTHCALPPGELQRASRSQLVLLLHESCVAPVVWGITGRILEDMGLPALALMVQQEMRREVQGYSRLQVEDSRKVNTEQGPEEKETSGYKDHVLTRFSQELAGRAEADPMGGLDVQALAGAFDPDLQGFRPGTVVLHTPSGPTRWDLSLRVLNCWAQGTLFHNLFSYVFLLSAGELRRLGEQSLGDLIARAWPDYQVPVAKILSQPQRLLFVMDRLEELGEGWCEERAVLCVDGGERRPAPALVHSLLRRVLLPECSLLLTTTNAGVRQLKCVVVSPRYLVVGGLSMESGTEPADQTLTGRYAAFLLHQLAPGKLATLRALCSLAVHGLWGERSLFPGQQLQAHGLLEAEAEALVHSGLLSKQEGGYAFLHSSFHAFFAALFYTVEALGPQGQGPHGRLRPKLAPQPGLASLLPWVRRFLFGFLSPGVASVLEAQLGSPVSPALQPLLRRWISGLGAAPANALDAFHLLFETQDAAFVRRALSGVQHVQLSIGRGADLLVSTFCLQSCPELRSLHINIRHLFLPDELPEPSLASPCGPGTMANLRAQWENFCSMLSTHHSLLQLHLGSSVLSEWATKMLCVQLRRPACSLEGLILKDAEVSGLRHLWPVLATQRHWRQVDLASTALCDRDLESAREALKHPRCSLTSLRLDSCALSFAGARTLSQALTSLTSLSLARNKLAAQTLQPICDALRSPQCSLRRLILASCGLTDAACRLLALALMSNCSLTHLCLADNALGTDGLHPLCRPLRLPGSTLQRLVLNRCHLDVTSCGLLMLALMSNSSLTHLSLCANPLGDGGLRLLCEALQVPVCGIQDLELASCSLTQASGLHLACVLAQSQQLQSLDLAANALGDLGVAKLCKGLKPEYGSLRRLGLEACGLTSECCAVLSSTLSCNRYLTSLNLLRNDFSPSGVATLCSAFAHPSCGLHVIGLWKQQYPPPVRKLLEETQQQKPQLTIRDDWYSLEEDDRYWWKN
ncbi:PREDICTED: NACHT, LRR and PYD domains-containing protein 5 [Dipodomys ordii]|uniref:NACHT, LRR and PYD domains-containing protein 5 n=1 Tax=Dipodomys ordii TaxID=10020 RepID=A0A1S3GMN9_DIPOR|nr:PREDICTED: NACHT, LRR and PYD domains-containing protein 5 [Dipodomys ordii]